MHTAWPTRRMRAIEHQWGRDGKPMPIRDVLDELLYRRNLTHDRAAEVMGVDPATLWRWRRRLEREAADSPQPDKTEAA